ncbi:50S ribosome-binding GTPase, partial [bacterium]|nr:50S ribosome-binding GTPase [bacterium]
MAQFDYPKKCDEFKSVCNELLQLKDEPLLHDNLAKLKETLDEKEKDSKLKIAVCGQYSSGKSSLIHALTNDDSIVIGQGITTDAVKVYPWKDVLFADTPGIYAGRTEHDALSLDYIKKADLLIYMITIQGFTREIGENFKKLIQGKYFEKTMLLMNKRNMEAAENEVNWRRDTLDFVGSADALAKLHFTIVDIEDYMTGEPELVEESHFDEFIRNLNLFIKERALTGKILSRINIVEAFLSAYIEALSKNQKNDEFTRRQLQIIARAIQRYNQAEKNASIRIRQNIKELKYHLLGFFTEDKARHLEEELDKSDLELERIMNDQGFQDDLTSIATEMSEAFMEVEQAAIEYDNRLKDISRNYNDISVNQIDLSLFKSGAAGLAQLTASVTKDGIIQVVHFFGGTFKPWGATKLTNFIKGLGP